MIKQQFLWIAVQAILLVPILGASQPDLLRNVINEGVSIRAIGMGNAYCAIAEEGLGFCYNPAGLARLGQGVQVQQDLVHNTLAVQSFYLSPFGVASVFKKDPKNDQDNHVEMTYCGVAKASKIGIDWGVSYKTIQNTSGGISVSGWSADAGVLCHISPSIQLGVVARDFCQKTVDISPSLAVGLAMFGSKGSWDISTDWIYQQEDQESPYRIVGHVGTEYCVAEGLTLRGGYFYNTLTVGASAQILFLMVDYVSVFPQVNTAMGQERIQMIGFRLGGDRRPTR